MLYFYLILLLALNASWLAGILFTLPGNWLMVISTLLFSWWQGWNIISAPVLIGIAVLALAGEIIDILAGAGGARRAGASAWGMLAAMGGAVAGAICGTAVIPVMGTILGACIGAGLATWIAERIRGNSQDKSIQSGLGAGKGALLGIVMKFALGCVIWMTVAIAAFWP